MESAQSAADVLVSPKGWFWMISLQAGPQFLSSPGYFLLHAAQKVNLRVNRICRAVLEVAVMFPTPLEAMTLAGIWN
jgi:hypothetical protein